MKYNFTLSFLFFMFIFEFSIAQTIDATLVELNFHDDGDPQNLTSSQFGFYFTATDGYFEKKFGRELWYSNGTPEGTFMVKDIRPGPFSSNPHSLVTMHNLLFFTSDDGIHGSELWISDGTEAGTMMVKDINPNADRYHGPISFMTFNGVLYFSAKNGTNGFELWRSNGTEAGTYMIKDINPTGDSFPASLFIFNNILYFTAIDGTNGRELWKSDGTASGTVMVKNIYSKYSVFPSINSKSKFLIMNNHFYFFADDGTHGSELWRSDGTESGTSMVKDIKKGKYSSSSRLKGTRLNNIIIFEASDGINGLEVWKSDGTESGTLMISNINKTDFNSILHDNTFIEFNNEVYFLADDNIHGNEIWKTDGTTNGTVLLKDISDGSSSIRINKFYVDETNNKLLFFLNTNSSDRTLWVSNGTEKGTFELSNIRHRNINGVEESFVTINNHTFLTGENDKYGNELWITDGTVPGTSFFVDMNHYKGSYASKFTNSNGNLFFRARGKEYGNQLFKSDGTIEGTKLIKDINPGYNCIDDLSDMKVINGTLFFSAIDGVHGYELWKSDGTESGTTLVNDINPNGHSMRHGNRKQPFTVINDLAYFYADDGVHGFELWTSDGTETGTYMIKDIYVGNSSNPKEFVLFNNTVYFIADDGTGTALWTTDGTESGTLKIINLNAMRVLKAVNDKLIIVAETSGTTYGPHDLWVSDGTSSGTSHLKSFGDGIDSDIRYTTLLNDELYFVAKNPNTAHNGLYKTDGTIANTVLLFDGAIDIDNILTCGNYVYFGIQGYLGYDKELWRTNGTITEKVTSSDTDLYIRNLTCYNNNLFYLEGSHPHKFWIINNNLNEPLDININVLNGQDFEAIEEIGATSDYLYFTAENHISGNEFYISDVDASTLSISNNYGFYNNTPQLVYVYPNPANEKVSIKSVTDILKFEIWDLSGKKIHQESNKDGGTEIIYDVGKLQSGIYFIKAFLSNGKIINVKFIVK